MAHLKRGFGSPSLQSFCPLEAVLCLMGTLVCEVSVDLASFSCPFLHFPLYWRLNLEPCARWASTPPLS